MINDLLSVIFPVYNEEKVIGSFINSAISELQGLNLAFEIIFINDGSTDNSAEIIKTYIKDHPNIFLINHNINKGYGAAIRSGFKEAKGDLVFFCDSDGQFDLRNLSRMITNIEGVDFVVGYRIKRNDLFYRGLFAFLWTGLINICFRIGVKDIDCAFKLFRKDMLNKINLVSNGAFINAEIFIKAKQCNFKFRQIGVTHYPRKFGDSTGANPKVIFRAFRELFYYLLNKH